MTDVGGFIDELFLQHRGDVATIKEYNRQYYLRNRKLKGPPKRVEEDEVPMKSPSGAKLVDYDGKGAGKATYSDGSSFDGNGWAKPASKAAAKSAVSTAQRLNSAQKKLSRARLLANRMSNPTAKRNMLQRIEAAQAKLNASKKNVPLRRSLG